MSSTILYKFRSGTTFEALQLPGSAARLFDVKKAIVQQKKLDQGSIEFDLAVRDATTNQEYTDESMILPRGTRVVVQRLPAAKGHGFLARLQKSQFTGSAGAAMVGGMVHSSGVVPPNFYTIGAQEEEDEFVSTTTAEDKELAALRAATESASNTTVSTATHGGMRPAAFTRNAPAGSGPPPPRYNQNSAASSNSRQRPNADPELREQEKLLQPKKRATGIPRTFLNLNAPPTTDATTGEETSVPLLQPNITGFKALVTRGGGQSELSAGTKKDLDYALKLTATTIPEYLLCAICHSVVRDAMILPWDPEGRTTCDVCIREALNQSGFRCPLTGQEGVSPDDLLPNHALRKAALSFIKDVLEKIEEIEEQQDEDDIGTGMVDDGAKEGQILEGETAEKGVLVSRKTAMKKKQEEDPFGAGDMDFGGDVFAVAAEPKEEAVPEEVEKEPATQVPDKATGENDMEVSEEPPTPGEKSTEEKANSPKDETQPEIQSADRGRSRSPALSERSPSESTTQETARRETKRRGPPVGYQMGPAGGAMGGPVVDNQGTNYPNSNSIHSPMVARGGFRGRGRWEDRGGGRGGRYNGGRGRFDPSYQPHEHYARDDPRGAGGVKRSRSNSTDDHSAEPHFREDYSAGRGGRGRGDYYDNGRGGPSFRGRGGRWEDRGGRGGRWEDRGGRGGRWEDRGRGFRGGRGRY